MESFVTDKEYTSKKLKTYLNVTSRLINKKMQRKISPEKVSHLYCPETKERHGNGRRKQTSSLIYKSPSHKMQQHRKNKE